MPSVRQSVANRVGLVVVEARATARQTHIVVDQARAADLARGVVLVVIVIEEPRATTLVAFSVVLVLVTQTGPTVRLRGALALALRATGKEARAAIGVGVVDVLHGLVLEAGAGAARLRCRLRAEEEEAEGGGDDARARKRKLWLRATSSMMPHWPLARPFVFGDIGLPQPKRPPSLPMKLVGVRKKYAATARNPVATMSATFVPGRSDVTVRVSDWFDMPAC